MMTTDEAAKAKAEAIALAEALHTILRESDDGESVRVAMAALQNTETGRDYMVANPIGY